MKEGYVWYIQMQKRTTTKTEIEIINVFLLAFTFFPLSDVLLCVIVVIVYPSPLQ